MSTSRATGSIKINISQIEERTFSMAEYTAFVDSIADEVVDFKRKQALGVAAEELR